MSHPESMSDEQAQANWTMPDSRTLPAIQKERENQPSFLPFQRYEKDWTQNPANEAQYNEILLAYEQSPTELKLLAECLDATVAGVYETLKFEELAGPTFYTLRPLDDQSLSLRNLQTRYLQEGSRFDAILGGYHQHGKRGQGQVLQSFTAEAGWGATIDIASQRKKGASEAELLHELAGLPTFPFKEADVASLQQYATAVVVRINDQAWDTANQKSTGCSVNGFFDPNNQLIFLPEQSSEPASAPLAKVLRHEYSHLVDYSIRKRYTKDDPLGERERSDPVFKLLKSEITAYLTNAETMNVGLEEAFEMIKAQLETEAYADLVDTEVRHREFEQLFTYLDNVAPMVRGLAAEAGLDPDDRQTNFLFARTFLTSLPDRKIALKMLSRLSETGLYEQGKNL